MAEGLEAVDVAGGLSLSEVTDLVASTHEARLVTSNGRVVAMLMPFGMKPSRTRDGSEAFLKAAGGWKAIDTDRFLAENRRSRDLRTRPAVQL